MSDNTAVLQELEIANIAFDASPNQKRVRKGYFRTSNGTQKRLRASSKSRTGFTLEDFENKVLIGDNTWFVPLGTEIVLKVDKFMDRATCPACKGSGHSEQTCSDCGGTKTWYMDSHGRRDKRAGVDRSALKQVECETCRASMARNPFPRATGKVPCQPCRGTGQRVGEAKIAVAEQYTEEPTTGIIMACGELVDRFRRGQRVLFSRFAGIEYEYDDYKYRVMDQRYPLGKIYGQGDVRAWEGAAGGQR